MPTTTEAPNVIKALANDARWELVHILSRGDHTDTELAKMLDLPRNQITHHMTHLREAGIVTERRSNTNPDEVYYSVSLQELANAFRTAAERLHPALLTQAPLEEVTTTIEEPLRILFLCTHNSARSQMAEGLARHLGNGRVEAFSAGTEATFIKPEAIEAMRQRGIDISGQESELLTTYLDEDFDYVITVCDAARESCPFFPGGKRQIHWSFADPSDVEDPTQRQAAFNRTARELGNRIQFLIMLAARQREAATA
jgi:ArsR family transcriptional regulator, arsenate/arsenite/antimonite-responsive transcriptional repressor / arsenate reductase (thioredoxin)